MLEIKDLRASINNRKILKENVKYRGKVDFFFISHHNIFLIINI